MDCTRHRDTGRAKAAYVDGRERRQVNLDREGFWTQPSLVVLAGDTVTSETDTLIERLRRAGISRAAISAAWPSWWTEEAASSPSGRAELRFSLARRLGLEPKPLLGERVEFVWNDEARFKRLSADSHTERSVLASYGIAIGQLLLRATPDQGTADIRSAMELREAILGGSKYVDLQSLITACWSLGIPVIHLRVFPLEAKAMHAMVVGIAGRYAILLGRDASYPAPIAFTLAHELGHIVLRHLTGASAIVDMEDPGVLHDNDIEERDADAFALTLLTGSPTPNIQTNIEVFGARSLASAVLDAGARHLIEPGTLALCLAYQNGVWPTANAALRYIYTGSKPVWREVNSIANLELDWESLGDEATYYLRNVMTGRQ